jgi:acyl-CoA synthetase (AMP-forming)/AMP-acid ligase II
VRFAVCGAAPVSQELLQRSESRFGFPIVEGYGLTEGTGASTCNPIDGVRKVGTVGPELQARIDKRADQLDADMAASGAAWAEDDAAAAIDSASWTVGNARLAVPDAIDARAYADELAAKAAGS